MFACRPNSKDTFVPVTRNYSSGTGATETVPVGATGCLIEIWGGGGSGNAGQDLTTSASAGGGGGGYSARNIAVVFGDTFTYTVGAAASLSIGGASSSAPGTSGGTSTVSGTVLGGSVSMTANGGAGGVDATGGVGGTASGGSQNTTGTKASDVAGFGATDGGAGAAAGGGAGGSFAFYPSAAGNGSSPGGGGGGCDALGGAGHTVSGAGASGRVVFSYT